jgi:hypothetical protein
MDSESAPPFVPNSLSPNSLLELSNRDFEQYLADSEWSAIQQNLQSLEHQSLARVTKEPEYLSYPTLTSGDRSFKSRPVGTTKCEKWFKDNGLIPPGSQLNAQAMALIMGFPEDYLTPLSPSPPITQVESEPDTLQVEPSPPPKPRSLFVESSICPGCQTQLTNFERGCGICGWFPSSQSVLGESENPLELKPNSVLGDFPKPSRASGWLEHYTKNKKLKQGIIATYPRVQGERDPDNPAHWYWAYRWEEKRGNAKSDNGYVTRAISLPRHKVQAVSLAIARHWSVKKILSFIRGKMK